MQLQSNSGILALEIVLGFSKEILLVKKVGIMNLWLIKPFKFKLSEHAGSVIQLLGIHFFHLITTNIFKAPSSDGSMFIHMV